tara:strand:+ start:6905 stop:7690 length:786 start_codon:yes stop_codon:yes gene_type:complete
MESCLYEGKIIHKRKYPVAHVFKYSLFMVCLRLDEVPEIFGPFWLWSVESWNLAYFRRRDHLGNEEMPLDYAVRDLVEEKTGNRPQGPIQLITHLCYFGVRFNPVSFYFCWNKGETHLEYIIAEINNTPWGEQHCYVFNVDKRDYSEMKTFKFKKEFHISPFIHMGMKYIWSFGEPKDKFHIDMEVWDEDQRTLDVFLRMTRTEISQKSLTRVLIQYPMITFKVIWGIYFQAFLLWFKRCPFYPHPKHLRNMKNIVKQSRK